MVDKTGDDGAVDPLQVLLDDLMVRTELSVERGRSDSRFTFHVSMCVLC